MRFLRRSMAPVSNGRMFKSKVVACGLFLLMVVQGAALAQPDWLAQFDAGEAHGEQMPWARPLSSTYGSSSASSSGGIGIGSAVAMGLAFAIVIW